MMRSRSRWKASRGPRVAPRCLGVEPPARGGGIGSEGGEHRGALGRHGRRRESLAPTRRHLLHVGAGAGGELDARNAGLGELVDLRLRLLLGLERADEQAVRGLPRRGIGRPAVEQLRRLALYVGPGLDRDSPCCCRTRPAPSSVRAVAGFEDLAFPLPLEPGASLPPSPRYASPPLPLCHSWFCCRCSSQLRPCSCRWRPASHRPC